jgi:mycothiol system anti-sigma-R factor
MARASRPTTDRKYLHMADCRETLRELETFLDGELSEHAQHAIESHLGGCIDCLQTFDFHAELKIVIARKCSNDEMPADLLSRIEQCLGADLDGDGQIG